MNTSDWIATSALIVSLFALGFSYVQWRRLTQEAFIKALQGEKASVAYVASWIAQNGVPLSKAYRSQLLTALCLAAVFEPSDRSRALLFAALRRYREKHYGELEKNLDTIEEHFKNSEEILDLKRGNSRLIVVREALNIKKPPTKVTTTGTGSPR
jgi:hypothetical protein